MQQEIMYELAMGFIGTNIIIWLGFVFTYCLLGDINKKLDKLIDKD